MSNHIQFVSKNQQYDAEHIKVFVHGYMAAVDNQDKAMLLDYIPVLPDNEDCLFAFWDSGTMKDVWVDILQSAARHISMSKLGIARGLFAGVSGGLSHFNGKKDYTRIIGATFFNELASFLTKYPSVKSVSLYGHSLGGRLLVEALLARQHAVGPTIRNLALLGTAREIKPAELQEIATHIQGRIYNFYSTADKVLVAKPSLEKCAGRHPITLPEGELQDQIFNAKLDIGHTDYWPILRTVINYVRNEGDRDLLPLNMQHRHVADDLLLFPVLYCAKDTELLLCSRILASKRSCSIKPDCTSAESIAHEIQLMGGNSIANKTRGNQGVGYAEIVEDVAEKLKIPSSIGQYTTLEKEALVYQKVLNALQAYAAVTGNTAGPDSPLGHYFSSDQCESSISALNKILGDLVVDPVGPAFSVTIPLVAVMHYIRGKDATAEFN